MDKIQYKCSLDFDVVFKDLINLHKPTIGMIQQKWRLSVEKAECLYEEFTKYYDEDFIQAIVEELKYEVEPPTLARIMGKFDVSYRTAEKVLTDFLEAY